MREVIEQQERVEPADFGADAEAIRRIEMQDRCTYLLSRPSGVAMEPTTCCNLRCRMCPQREQSVGPEWRGHHMSDKIFDAAREFFPGAIVFFGGKGEPFMHPRFPAMLERAAREARGVSLISNATLWTQKICELLVELHIGQVIVSIDARDPALYEYIRGFPMERTLRNIRALMALRRQSGLPRPSLSLNFTMMRCNASEMPAVVELATELGADEVTYGHLGYPGVGSSQFEEQERLDYADPAVQDSIRRTRETAARCGIHVQFPDFSAILGKYEALSPSLLWTVRTRQATPAPGEARERWDAAMEKVRDDTTRRLRAAGAGEKEIKESLMALRSKLVARVQQEAFAEHRRTVPSFAAPSAAGDTNAPQHAPFCEDAFRAIFINWAGDVYLNCEAYHAGDDLLGDLKVQSLPEIWNGERIRELRRWWYTLQDDAAAQSEAGRELHA